MLYFKYISTKNVVNSINLNKIQKVVFIKNALIQVGWLSVYKTNCLLYKLC